MSRLPAVTRDELSPEHHETVALAGHYSLVGLVVNGFDVAAPQGSVTF